MKGDTIYIVMNESFGCSCAAFAELNDAIKAAVECVVKDLEAEDIETSEDDCIEIADKLTANMKYVDADLEFAVTIFKAQIY